jgi:hypothetical protein
MRILFDQGTPAPLRHLLSQHSVSTAFECGWSTLTNGDLLAAAESAGYDLLMTTDRNLQYQQNLNTRAIAIVVLSSTNWPRIREHVAEINNVLLNIQTGGFIEIAIPN